MNTALHKFETFALPKASSAKRMVIAGLSILAILVSMYMYFVGKIVFDVVARRHAESSIRATQSTVSSLEMAYFKELRTLDLDRAASIGLIESKGTLYANRGTATVGMVAKNIR